MSGSYKDSFQIFTPAQIASLRKGGNILHECLKHVAMLVKPGVQTGELDRVAEAFIRDHGALPGFKGYHGYAATLCTSVNDVCVHGIPGKEKLREGDIVGIDCGVLYDGLYTDAALTVPVSRVSGKAERLLSATQDALSLGLAEVRAGARTGNIGATIHKRLQQDGFDSVRPLTGHGLGSTLHQFPDIPNFGTKGKGHVLRLHTIVAIEPISTAGSNDVTQDDDGWTLRTADGALSAHFEHTVLVTEEGCEVLT
ncbi:MAG: type I methionyl aminopeptidase [Patescibacteria group bacterium]